MFGTVDLFTYIIGSFIVIILPGPNSMYSLTVSASYGVRKGYLAVSGIFIGDSILILLTVLGADALLKLYPTIFIAIKMLGGLYLMYLGVNLFIGAYEAYQNRNLKPITSQSPDFEPFELNSKTIEFTSASKPSNKEFRENFFLKGLLLSITNPKAILFFLSFFVQFVDPNYANPLLSFFVLAIILQIISLCYQNLMVLAGERLATRFRQNLWLVMSSMGLVGLLFIGFAISLWLAKLN